MIATRRPARRAIRWRLVLEKLPLLAIAVAGAALTWITHSSRPDPLTIPERLANATISYVVYLGQYFVPVGLNIYYSHPDGGWPAWQVAEALLLLLAITTAAVAWRRSLPFLLVGWFWYVGMLVPVLGLTHVGDHARADRYTYLPEIGLSIALVWGAMRVAAGWSARRWVFGIGSAAMMAALVASAWRQTGFWQDDQTVWRRAVACDANNPVAHFTLGDSLDGKDDDAASDQYRAALNIGAAGLEALSLDSRESLQRPGQHRGPPAAF